MAICNLYPNDSENIQEGFDLEAEMIRVFGVEKTKDVLAAEISEYYKDLLPLKAEGIASAGPNKFNRKGELVTEFDEREILFQYSITFRRKTIDKGLNVAETLYYMFN